MWTLALVQSWNHWQKKFHHPDQSRDWRVYQISFYTVSRYIKNTWHIDIILYFWRQIYRPIKFKVNFLSFYVPDLDFTFLEMNPFTLVNGKPYPLDMRGELDDTAAFKNFKKYVPFCLVDFYHSCFISLWITEWNNFWRLILLVHGFPPLISSYMTWFCRWGNLEFPMPFGRVMSPTESFIHGLDEKVLLMPQTRIWNLFPFTDHLVLRKIQTIFSFYFICLKKTSFASLFLLQYWDRYLLLKLSCVFIFILPFNNL